MNLVHWVHITYVSWLTFAVQLAEFDAFIQFFVPFGAKKEKNVARLSFDLKINQSKANK